jgi:hypothetical protein
VNEIIEIDDVIPEALQNTIESILLGEGFPLYLHKETVNYVKNGNNSDLYWDKNSKDAPQFVHGIVKNECQTSEYWSVIRPLLYFLIAKVNKELTVDRCKVNVNYTHNQFTDSQHYPPHKDPAEPGNYTAIYYVNDCDGDTILFKEPSEHNLDGEYEVAKRVTPKKGRIVFFPSNTVHCGTPPKTSELRCVINFVLKETQC